MQTFDSVSCGNNYTAAATLANVFQSNGGFFQITGNDAFVQLQYGIQGQTYDTAEVHVGVGNGVIFPGTTGIKFRNYVAGSAAIVSASISEQAEPTVALTAGGIATPSTPTAVTGTIPMLGTTPTSGTGFTYTHTNGTGAYVFTFAAGSFATAPTVVLTPIGQTSGGNFPVVRLPAVATASGFSVDTFARAGGAEDCAFSFIAETTV